MHESPDIPLPRHHVRLDGPVVPAAGVSSALAEYLSLSDSLKRLPGTDFEKHDHPATVLDRATGPDIRVWGWWAEGETPLPCLLWVSERGWSATVVEPGELDSEGYERAFWSHRVNLLDLAIACALGPCRSLDELAREVAEKGSFGFGDEAGRLQEAVRWGIFQVRAAERAAEPARPRRLAALAVLARVRGLSRRGRRRAVLLTRP